MHNVELIVWKVAKADPALASVRYRCLMPLLGLKAQGISSVVLAGHDDIQDFSAVRALVLVKSFFDRDVALARRAIAAGVRLCLDICDNIFVAGWGGLVGESVRRNFLEMAALADAIATTGPAMVSCLIAQGVDPSRIHVAPDQLERRETTASLLRDPSWRADPYGVRRGRSAARAESPRFSKVLLGSIESLVEDASDAAAKISRKRRTVVWFGNSGASYGKYGLTAVADILDDVASVNAVVPLRLVAVTDDREKVSALARNQPFPIHFRRWRPLEVFDRVAAADLCVVPNSADPFSATKSANRIVLALSLGVPVVASSVASAEPFADCIALDDWRGGMLRYFNDAERASKDVQRGQKIIAAEYSEARVAAIWRTILEDERRP